MPKASKVTLPSILAIPEVLFMTKMYSPQESFLSITVQLSEADCGKKIDSILHETLNLNAII
jgi:hypothetical protein